MKRIIISGILCVLWLAQFFYFSNCSNRAVLTVVSAGNPTEPTKPGSDKLLQAMCGLLVGCHSGLSLATCLDGLINTTGIAEALGAPPKAFPYFGSLISEESLGAARGNSASIDLCLSDIKSLSCNTPSVALAYQRTSTSPFSGVAQLFSNTGTSCRATFSPPIILGGMFDQIEGEPAPFLGKVFNDGNVNALFRQRGNGLNRNIWALAQDSSNRILAAGEFTSYDSQAAPGLIRLNSDGSRDASFDTSAASFLGTGFAVTVDSLDQVLVAITHMGPNDVGQTVPRYFGRFSVTGAVDPTFKQRGSGFDGEVHSIVIDPNGKILIGGFFTKYGGVSGSHVIRLNSDGSVDTSFQTAGSGINGNVNIVTLDGNGRILIGGVFDSYNGIPTSRIARLNIDGSLDTTFSTGGSGLLPGNSEVFAIDFDTSGKIYLGGNFQTFNGQSRPNLIRLNSDGSYDSDFNNSAELFNDTVFALKVDTLGRIYVGGGFYSTAKGFVAPAVRLQPNGVLDSTYSQYNSVFHNPIFALRPQVRAILISR